MNYTMAASVVLLAALLAGCGDNAVSGPEMTQDFFPMEAGDWWAYDYCAVRTQPDSMLWEEGSETLQVLAVAGDTCTVERTFSTWYWLGSAQPDTMSTLDTLTYVVNSDSVLILTSDSTSVKYLDYPLEEGKTWDDYEVLDMDGSVTVPGGTFTGCAVISTWSDTYGTDIMFYYASGTGLVTRYADGATPWGQDHVDIHFDLSGSSYGQ